MKTLALHETCTTCMFVATQARFHDVQLHFKITQKQRGAITGITKIGEFNTVITGQKNLAVKVSKAFKVFIKLTFSMQTP